LNTEVSVNIYIWTNCSTLRTNHGEARSEIEFVSKNGKRATKTLCHEYGYSTNNAMVLYQLLDCLNSLTMPCYITLYTDNPYVTETFQHKRLYRWKKDGWLNGHGQEIANRKAWESIEFLRQIHCIVMADPESDRYRQYRERKMEGVRAG